MFLSSSYTNGKSLDILIGIYIECTTLSKRILSLSISKMNRFPSLEYVHTLVLVINFAFSSYSLPIYKPSLLGYKVSMSNLYTFKPWLLQKYKVIMSSSMTDMT